MLGRIYSDVLLDYTSSRGDDDEAGDHALHGTDHGWLAEEDDVQYGPDQEAHGCTDVGVDDSNGGIDVGCVRISSIESGPPQPE